MNEQDINKVIANFDAAINNVFQRKESKSDEVREKATAYVNDNIFLDKTPEKMEEALLASTAQEFNDIYEKLNNAGDRFSATKNIIYKNYWLEDEIQERIDYLNGQGD